MRLSYIANTHRQTHAHTHTPYGAIQALSLWSFPVFLQGWELLLTQVAAESSEWTSTCILRTACVLLLCTFKGFTMLLHCFLLKFTGGNYRSLCVCVLNKLRQCVSSIHTSSSCLGLLCRLDGFLFQRGHWPWPHAHIPAFCLRGHKPYSHATEYKSFTTLLLKNAPVFHPDFMCAQTTGHLVRKSKDGTYNKITIINNLWLKVLKFQALCTSQNFWIQVKKFPNESISQYDHANTCQTLTSIITALLLQQHFCSIKSQTHRQSVWTVNSH